MEELNGDDHVDYGTFMGYYGAISYVIFLFKGDNTFESYDFSSFTIYYDDYAPELTPVGDVNGDSLEDVIVGNPSWGSNRGEVFILSGDSFDVGISEFQNFLTPICIEIKGPYPNPFNKSTLIRAYIGAMGEIELKVYNNNGIQILHENHYFCSKGWKDLTVKFNSNTPSGVYLYQVKYKGENISGKMIFLK